MSLLTLSMIVKNEEKNLADCLESVKGIADEIVIVDTGSTDRTISIAQSFGARILHFNWINDFSAARNYALRNSTGNWVLYLDADERLMPESADELRRIIYSNDQAGYYCSVISPDSHNGKPNVIRYTRLFRNSPLINFSGAVHEQIIFSLEKNNYSLRNSNIKIFHTGYDIPRDQIMEKAKRNLELLTTDYNRGNKSPYLIFQIAQTYGVLEDNYNALRFFEMIIQSPESTPLFKSHAYRYKASIEFQRGNVNSALRLATEGLRNDPVQPLLNLLMAKIYYRLKEYETSLKFIVKSWETNNSNERKDFSLTADNKNLLITALQICAAAGNKYYFNRFFETLSSLDQTLITQNEFLILIKALFLGEYVPPVIRTRFAAIVNEQVAELTISLLENYPDDEVRLNMMESVYPKLQYKSFYLCARARSFSKAGKNEEAIESFERAVSIGMDDPSVIFFLSSLYVQGNHINKLAKLIEDSKRRFANYPGIPEKISLLEEKVKSLF